ncbi:MAG: flagellar biosynthesis protein FlhB [Deltaproteobacteria bacterium]|nr:MAG: flagellar biosynthesis protein FlhB [Deltaproteobacteria bacterium]
MAEKDARKKAVALRYVPGADPAPKVTAKGVGSVAEKIIAIAEKHGVPVKNDPDLVEVLASVDVDKEIPESVYVVVAELLAFIYRVNGEKKTS